MSEDIIRPFEEKMVSSALLEIPRNTYQRGLNPERVKRISHSFDERIANEPKVSHRDGRYVVFDGQHVIAARVDKNSGEELPIRCKIYSDLTEQEEVCEPDWLWRTAQHWHEAESPGIRRRSGSGELPEGKRRDRSSN